jgi:hypothetical protein
MFKDDSASLITFKNDVAHFENFFSFFLQNEKFILRKKENGTCPNDILPSERNKLRRLFFV